jgi:hypothetical protein
LHVTSYKDEMVDVIRVLFRRLIGGQIYLSNTFDRILPEKYRVDGNTDYRYSFLPKYLNYNLRVYDVGGGKRPFIDPNLKKNWELQSLG